MALTITKQQFYDIFLVCLYWQSDPLQPRSCCTTVDKVGRILNGLGLLSDEERRILQTDTVLQELFWKNIDSNISGGSLIEQMGQSKKEIIVRVSGMRLADNRFNKRRLLRDERIYITHRGMKVVEKELEAKYSGFITVEQYLEEIQRQQEVFDDLDESARNAIYRRYRDRVEIET